MKKFLSLIIVLLFPFFVSAKVTEFGDNVELEGEHDSTKIVAGNNVDNEATVDGITFLFGNGITDKGNVDYGAYAGNTLSLSGNYKHDLFAAGSSIKLEKGAVVSRDAYLAAANVNINTNIGRNLYVGAEEVDLTGVTINGDAYVFADKIKMDEATVISGRLTYYDDTKVEGLESATINDTKVVANTYKVEEKEIKNYWWMGIKDWFISLAISFVTLLIVLAVFPKLRERIENEAFEVINIIKQCGIGFGLLVAIPVACIIGMITVLLLPVSLLMLCFYGFAIYLGGLFAEYYLGKKIYELFNKKGQWVLEALLGILLYHVIKIVPLVGGLAGFLVHLFGIGLVFKMLFEQFGKKANK